MTMFSRKSFSNKYKDEWFVIIGAALVTISFILGMFWGIKEPQELTINSVQNYYAHQMAWQHRLQNIAWTLGLAILTISSTAIGLRSVRKKGIFLKAVCYVLGGLLICVYQFAVILAANEIGNQVENLKTPDLKKMEVRLTQANLSLHQKAILSSVYAEEFYLQKGQRINYITESGDSKLYEPTKNDLEIRETQATSRAIWAATKKKIAFAIPFWIVVTLISLILGIFTPIKKSEPQSAT